MKLERKCRAQAARKAGANAKFGAKATVARAAIVLALMLSAPAGSSARAEELDEQPVPELSFEPVPEGSAPGAAGAADSALLSLPALDVEWAHPFNKSVRVGDELELKVTNAPDGATAIAAADSPDALGDQGWSIAPDEKPTGKPAPGELYFLATPIHKGTLTLPSLVIRNAAGNAVARTNPFSLAVVSAIASDDPHPDQPAELRPPEALAFPWWMVGVAALAFILLGVGAYYGWRRWKKKPAGAPAPAPAKPALPEDEEALAALVELEQRGFLAQGRFKAHYFRVSEVLKHYLGRRYSFDAAESTTSELLRHLNEHEGRWEPEKLSRIGELFARMDVIKFTDQLPGAGEAQGLVEEARQLVRLTARPPAPAGSLLGADGGKPENAV